MSCLNIAENGVMFFLKTIKYSKLKGYWQKPEAEKRLSTFIRLNVICSSYGMICRSEEFYGKGNWRKFERSLLRKGWRVVKKLALCPGCYRRYINDK